MSEQDPVAANVTDVALTVQTDSVVLVNVTASPDEAVALTVSGDCSIVLLPGLANVIAWGWLTLKPAFQRLAELVSTVISRSVPAFT